MTSKAVNAVRKAKLKSVRISKANYLQAKAMADNLQVPLYRVIDNAVWQVWRQFKPISIV